MSIQLPIEQVQTEFEQSILMGWHQARGADSGQISACWGEDRVVVMIEDVFYKGERLLSQSETGKAFLEQYVHELLAYIVEEQASALSELLQREIESTSLSANTCEGWVMIIFRFTD